MKVITIADLSSWLGLESTKVRGLSFRAIAVPGILVTSTGECGSAAQVAWLKSVNLGATDIWVVGGDHPVESLISEPGQKTLRRIAEYIKRGYKVEFFEAGKNDGEIRIAHLLSELLGLTTEDEFWAQYVVSNHPSLWGLGSKITQRALAKEAGEYDLFTPHCIVRSFTELASQAEVILQDHEECMVRIDGEASSDGQCIHPKQGLEEIWLELNGEKNSLLVEPFFGDHVAVGALLKIEGQHVHFLGASDQLLVRSGADGKPLSYGNLVFSRPTEGSCMTEKVFSCIRDKALRLGDLLMLKGVQGCLSVDMLILPDGCVHITEANIRLTNGWYAYHVKTQIENIFGAEVCTGLNIFKPTTDVVHSFERVINVLGDLIYRGDAPYGVIPLVTTLLPKQCHFQLVAPTVQQYQALMQSVWERMSCEKGVVPTAYRGRIALPTKA